MDENIGNNANPSHAVLIRYYFKLVINTNYYGAARGTINATNFELNSPLINMVQQKYFGGSATIDTHLHLLNF